MFPGTNLSAAAQKAQTALNGTPDNLAGVSAAAQRLGVNAQLVNGFFAKYGGTPQAQAICKMMGTTPEALKADADRIVGGQTGQPRTLADSHGQANTQTRFPRLK
jgi:hypothetical protein